MNDELLSLWPSNNRVRECIKTDAEAYDEAVFLAVHQPVVFREVEVGSVDKTGAVRTEEDLLARFTQSDPPEGRVILPIVGSSGVGKSHVVKWLDAQLKRRPDFSEQHIIRVPKGASLKSVLRILLEGLPGPRYDGFREALHKARDQLDPELAARLLNTHLVSELEKESGRASQRLSSGVSPDEQLDRKIKSYGTRKHLPALLSDPEVWDRHFFQPIEGGNRGEGSGPIALLAEHITQEGGTDLDQRKHKFAPEDLKLTHEIELKDLSVSARDFYVMLDTADESRRTDAARVLNHVLDASKSAILDLAGESLTELFADVRAALKEDEKELILLIEDFAVLSGIQGALLDVMNKEAERPGEQGLCTMRTALAYTSGYLPPSTTMTRAGSEWLIQDIPGNSEEIYTRIVSLVGAYLNAARWGADKLRKEFQQSEGNQDWVPNFDPENAEQDVQTAYEAFGRSTSNHLLFPFNANAIAGLANEGSTDSRGRLVLNPRSVIRNVIRKVLDHRDTYQADQFPPSTLGINTLKSAALIEEVKKRADASSLDRYLKVLGYWGGQPRTQADAAVVPEEVYRAFSLQPLDFGSPVEEPSSPNKEPAKQYDEPKLVDDFFDITWRPMLEDWRSGAEIEQAKARQLRNWISEAIVHSLPDDWPGIPNISPAEVARYVYLPGTRGSGGLEPAKAMIIVCSEEERTNTSRSASIQLDLEAVIRARHHSGTWDIERGEELSARYAEFVDGHKERALTWIRDRTSSPARIDALVQGLMVSAKALALPSSSRQGLSANIETLFLPAIEPSEPTNEDPWDQLCALLRRIRAVEGSGDSWVNQLLVVGARQGTGPAVHAIDVTLLEKSISAFSRDWNLNVELPDSSLDPKSRQFRTEYNELKRRLPTAIKHRTVELESWRNSVTSQFGDDPNKDDIVDSIREFLTLAKGAGVIRGEEIEQLRSILSDFKKCALGEAMKETSRLGTDSSTATIISVLGKDYGRTIHLSQRLLNLTSAILADAKKAIDGERTRTGAGIAEQALAGLREEVNQLGCLVNDYVSLSK